MKLGGLLVPAILIARLEKLTKKFVKILCGMIPSKGFYITKSVK